MATLNFIMPHDLKEGFCNREEKQHKNRHSWVPTGQSMACATDCVTDLTGEKVVFTTFGMETVTLNGKQYSFIGENHLICSG